MNDLLTNQKTNYYFSLKSGIGGYLRATVIDDKGNPCQRLVHRFIAEAFLDYDKNLVLKNPDERGCHFEYISLLFNDKYTDNKNIFLFCNKEKYYYHKGDIFEHNPWEMDTYNPEFKKNNEWYKLVNEALNINLKSNNDSYQCDNYGIICKGHQIKIYFRSFVKDKDYVIDVITKIFTAINEEDLLNERIENIENEEFEDCLQYNEICPQTNWSTIYVIQDVELNSFKLSKN
jgi:hypothetical protein